MRRKRPRLSKSADFQRVYRQGRSVSSRHLVLYAFPRDRDVSGDTGVSKTAGGADARLGVSVGRRVGGAVQRNRVKRLLREAFWSLGETVPTTHDYVIVARPGSAELAEAGGLEGFARDLSRLLEELGEPTPSGPAAAV